MNKFKTFLRRHRRSTALTLLALTALAALALYLGLFGDLPAPDQLIHVFHVAIRRIFGPRASPQDPLKAGALQGLETR